MLSTLEASGSFNKKMRFNIINNAITLQNKPPCMYGPPTNNQRRVNFFFPFIRDTIFFGSNWFVTYFEVARL